MAPEPRAVFVDGRWVAIKVAWVSGGTGVGVSAFGPCLGLGPHLLKALQLLGLVRRPAVGLAAAAHRRLWLAAVQTYKQGGQPDSLPLRRCTRAPQPHGPPLDARSIAWAMSWARRQCFRSV